MGRNTQMRMAGSSRSSGSVMVMAAEAEAEAGLNTDETGHKIFFLYPIPLSIFSAEKFFIEVCAAAERGRKEITETFSPPHPRHLHYW